MADITFHETHFRDADPANVSCCDGYWWAQFGGVTFFVADRESADLLASALNLCRYRVQQKHGVVIDAEYPEVGETGLAAQQYAADVTAAAEGQGW